MNYYYIRKKDQQYSNCIYLANISKKARYNDDYRTFTIPGKIEYTFTEQLYKEFKEDILKKHS